MGKVKFILPLFVILFFVTFSSAFAHHKEMVLGDSIEPADIVFPEDIAYGPGFFLPDSPLYALDLIWQKFRLAVSFSPEAKAKLSSQVAGERLAELRLMLAKNNSGAVTNVLAQMEKDAEFASQELSNSSAAGSNVEDAAQELNEALKIQRRVLVSLANQSSSDLSLKFQATRKSLLKSKLEIEDELPADLLANEMKEELENETQENLEDSEKLSDSAQANLDVLNSN